MQRDNCIHVRHFTLTKAIRDLGCSPERKSEDIDVLVEFTGERMVEVWDETHAPFDSLG